MNETVICWLPVQCALLLAGIGLLARNQGWGLSGWLTATAVILPLMGSAVWAFLKKSSEEALENNPV